MGMRFGDPGQGSRRMRTLDDLAAGGQTAIARVDYNVPLAAGEVADDTRIRASLETVTQITARGAALILMSHLGRPTGPDPALGMAPVGRALEGLLGQPVAVARHVVGDEVTAAAGQLAPGGVLLLENLRFEAGEKSNDPALAAGLAALADVYVNDAFGTAHRAAASTVGVARLLPAYAGRLMQRELETLSGAVYGPDRPLVVILGGAKISGKIGVLRNLLPRADGVLVGGGIANTFLAAQGVAMGESLVEPGRLADAAEMLAAGEDRLRLPVDLVIADTGGGRRVVAARDGVPPGWRALDVGPRTSAAFEAALGDARTVVWNGPLGAFETPPFDEATTRLARVVAGLDAHTIVGGGDSVAAVRAAGVAPDIDWISTGGGAMLTLLAGDVLPAVEALAASVSSAPSASAAG